MWFVEMMHADTMRTAAGLLARRGYENVQAAALAEALRISVGTLYRHYGSKRGLALAVRDFTEKELSYQADVAFLLKYDKPGVDFAQAFFTFWWELAWWALTKPDLCRAHGERSREADSLPLHSNVVAQGRRRRHHGPERYQHRQGSGRVRGREPPRNAAVAAHGGPRVARIDRRSKTVCPSNRRRLPSSPMRAPSGRGAGSTSSSSTSSDPTASNMLRSSWNGGSSASSSASHAPRSSPDSRLVPPAQHPPGLLDNWRSVAARRWEPWAGEVPERDARVDALSSPGCRRGGGCGAAGGPQVVIRYHEARPPGEEEMRGAVRQRALHPVRQAAVLRS